MTMEASASGKLRHFPHALLLACFILLCAAPAALGASTVVSLTFDDGLADQYAARSILGAHGTRGTFYVNSNTISSSGHLGWNDLNDIAIDGNEIAGHTLDHIDLTTATTAEAQRQVCDDRSHLQSLGFSPIDFAYPYGARNATVIQIVKDCGYSSARRSWGLRSPGSPVEYPYAESIPAQDTYQIRTPDSVRDYTTLSTIEGYVTQAENNGGGWVPIVLHHICDGCDSYSISAATLNAFLDWLQFRTANGTVVKTVRNVIAPPPAPDTTAPASSISCNAGGCSSGWYRSSVSIGLSATDAGGSGVDVIRYTTNGSDPTVTSPTYGGPFSVSGTTTVKFRAWDKAGNVEPVKSQLVRIDTAAPTVSITSPSSGATVSGFVTVTGSAADGPSGVRDVRFYANGSLLGTSTSAPYSVRWNAKKARGTRTLTAVAQDLAGNTTTSSPVTVTVR
jgi:peptidoglycan/xylan/chitin deacetylase (PgdA/CDA1 family)